MLLVFLFVVTPLVELAILIYLGNLIGVLETILIVIVTGLLGAIMARRQGLAILSRIRGNIEQGIVPSGELFQAFLILVGGLLLLTPGLITDLIGFSLLIPRTRNLVIDWLRRLIQHRIENRQIYYWRIDK
jgi:UPF0716 protein FxsA